MKTYLNIKESKIDDDNIYKAAIARYYLAEATKKPKKNNLWELMSRFSYISEAARLVDGIVDDETIEFMRGLNKIPSLETAIDMLKDAMDYRSPAFIPDFRVLSSAANSFNKFEDTPWIETMQEVNKEREKLGLFTLCI